MSKNERLDFLLCVYDGDDGKVKLWLAQTDDTPIEGVGTPRGARWIRATQINVTDVIVDRAELAALREKAKGPRIDEVPPVTHASTEAFTAAPPVSYVVKTNPAPRPFKVGDFLRDKANGNTGTVTAVDSTNVKITWSSGTVGDVWWPMADFELLTPAPAPEATAARDGTLKAQYVPTTWLDDALKVSEEWMARALAAEANADFLRRSIGACHQMISCNKSEFQIEKDWKPYDLPPRLAKVMCRAVAAERERDELQLRYGALEIEARGMRECLAKFTDGGMSGDEVRAARNDERERYVRECAKDFMAARLSNQYYGAEAIIGLARWVDSVAETLADVRFGKKGKMT